MEKIVTIILVVGIICLAVRAICRKYIQPLVPQRKKEEESLDTCFVSRREAYLQRKAVEKRTSHFIPKKEEIYCPVCESHNVCTWVYGLPDFKAWKANGCSDRLGGCDINDWSPKYHCNDCDSNFGYASTSFRLSPFFFDFPCFLRGFDDKESCIRLMGLAGDGQIFSLEEKGDGCNEYYKVSLCGVPCTMSIVFTEKEGKYLPCSLVFVITPENMDVIECLLDCISLYYGNPMCHGNNKAWCNKDLYCYDKRLQVLFTLRNEGGALVRFY